MPFVPLDAADPVFHASELVVVQVQHIKVGEQTNFARNLIREMVVMEKQSNQSSHLCEVRGWNRTSELQTS